MWVYLTSSLMWVHFLILSVPISANLIMLIWVHMCYRLWTYVAWTHYQQLPYNWDTSVIVLMHLDQDIISNNLCSCEEKLLASSFVSWCKRQHLLDSVEMHQCQVFAISDWCWTYGLYLIWIHHHWQFCAHVMYGNVDSSF